MQAIGIDLGTTGLCAVVLDADTGAVLRTLSAPNDTWIAGQAWERLQDADRIVAAATALLDALLGEDTAVIGVTGQMHGIVYTDKAGHAVSPLYTWQDGRGDLPCGDTTCAARLNSHSGYGLVTDLYNRENGLVPPDAVGFCTVHDYLVMRLCGLTRAAVHPTDAASFGCFDVVQKRFTCVCDVQVVDGYSVAGAYKGVPVGVAIGDNQAGVLSTLAGGREVLLNVGTGSQVSAVCDAPVDGLQLETRPYFEGKYLAVGAALCGGRAYALLRDFYAAVLQAAGADTAPEAVYAAMDALLAAPCEESLAVDTRFSGTRADSAVRGSISGISAHNFTPAALTRGVLEGMARELYDMYREMGVDCPGLVGAGNGVRKNAAFVHAAERLFGMPMRVSSRTEEAACGAALFGLLCIGRYRGIGELPLV